MRFRMRKELIQIGQIEQGHSINIVRGTGASQQADRDAPNHQKRDIRRQTPCTQ